jgi:diguanylate cyclase (GGDEF)-like protein/PAS domain S-box-containing protein
MHSRSDRGPHNRNGHRSTKPWFIASIAVTVVLLGVLGWNLFFSLNLLHSFKSEELALERASRKLLLYAERMTMATRVGTLSGNLKWREKYESTQPKLERVLHKLPLLVGSERINTKVEAIRSHLSRIMDIETRAYDLVSRGEKKKALRLLAGWSYTKNNIRFEKETRDLVQLIHERIARKTSLQKKNALSLIAIASFCFALLLFLWMVTIRLWKEQVETKKKAEEDLRHSEEKYRKLFDTSPDAIGLVDDQGTFLTVNPSMASRFGLARKKLEGRSGFELMPEDVAARRLQMGRDSIRSQSVIYFEDQRSGRHLQNFFVPVSLQGDRSCFQVISRDVTYQKECETKLNYLSFHDSLTGISNRNCFEEAMQRMQADPPASVGIIVCDVDGLKFVNDTLGHDTGDELLVNTASLLRRNFRTDDVIARIGGDEYAVLVADADAKAVEDMVRRLRGSISDCNAASPGVSISLSIGYVTSDSGTTDMYSLFREADNRMYREKMQREKSSRNHIVQALVKSMEARDFFTEGHSERLQQLVLPLARTQNVPENVLNDLLLLARFHDLGKVGIADEILFKPDKLTPGEAAEMRKHSEIGHRIAKSVPDLAPIADWILKHHEWWNGQGYPLGLAGEDIPLPCRILAIADAFDAMTSDRPYRRAMSRGEALGELRRYSGTQFDPWLVERFIALLEQGEDGSVWWRDAEEPARESSG